MFEYSSETKFAVHPNQIIVDAREFANWRNGLPEWVKNASDAYERANTPKSKRVIVVMFVRSAGNGGRPAFACLDFVGMTSDDLITKLAYYGDPEASGNGDQVVGGHGNGGKLFAVGGFNNDVIWRSVKHGLLNEFGLPEPKQPKLAFREDAVGEVRDRPCTDLESVVTAWLSEIGLSTSALPAEARTLAATAEGVTLVMGFDPGSMNGVVERSIPDALRSHPQCRTPLETADLFVVTNGKLENGGNPLRLEKIEPYKGFADPYEIAIPEYLRDPFDQSDVATTAGGTAGCLVLLTSDKMMPQDRYLKGRHTIDFKQGAKIRGSKSVRDLAYKGAFTDRIYGTCESQALTEEYESQTRGSLVETPFVRALEHWLREQIVEYAAEIERASADNDKAIKDKEKEKRLSQQMTKLNDWINRIVDEIVPGSGEEIDVDGGGRKPPSPRTPLPIAPVGKIEIAIDENIAGTKVPLSFSTEFYGVDGVQRVRPEHVTWHSNHPSVAAFSGVTGMINTYAPGAVDIWCESDSSVISNRITIQVVDCESINLYAEKIDVAVGSRRRIWATGITRDGHQYEGIRLNWATDSNDILRVGLAGFVTGLSEGSATVTARDGNGRSSSCKVTIVPRSDGPGGPNRPKYYLSEVQKAPYDAEPPAFSKDNGLVYQRQIDIEHNVWWINIASPLARLVYEQNGESSEQWVMYLGERIADAAIEAAMQGSDRGQMSRTVNEVLEEVSQHRMTILESFTVEFGSTKQLVL